ncbi:MAG: HAD family hydrolase [Nanoarchaeota archaeon]
MTLVLLSNNSFDWGEQVLKNLGYEKYFKHLVFSHNVGCAKPGKEIFEIALDKVKDEVDGNEEVLFIDDKEKNFLVPKSMGMQTLLFTTFDQVYRYLRMQ